MYRAGRREPERSSVSDRSRAGIGAPYPVFPKYERGSSRTAISASLEPARTVPERPHP